MKLESNKSLASTDKSWVFYIITLFEFYKYQQFFDFLHVCFYFWMNKKFEAIIYLVNTYIRDYLIFYTIFIDHYILLFQFLFHYIGRSEIYNFIFLRLKNICVYLKSTT